MLPLWSSSPPLVVVFDAHVLVIPPLVVVFDAHVLVIPPLVVVFDAHVLVKTPYQKTHTLHSKEVTEQSRKDYLQGKKEI